MSREVKNDQQAKENANQDTQNKEKENLLNKINQMFNINNLKIKKQRTLPANSTSKNINGCRHFLVLSTIDSLKNPQKPKIT